jgi:hypothetical protein
MLLLDNVWSAADLPACVLQGRNTYLTAELRAGIVAFLTICYIIAVSSSRHDGLTGTQHACIAAWSCVAACSTIFEEEPIAIQTLVRDCQ